MVKSEHIRPMNTNKILVCGAGGLIGQQLVVRLIEQGYTVSILTHSNKKLAGVTSYSWDIDQGTIDPKAFEGVSAIIHLAGESVAGKRWTTSHKKAILDSRVRSTRLLFKYISSRTNSLECYIGASASGYYGNAGNTYCSEDSPCGTDFLAQVCNEWEREHQQIMPFAKYSSIVRIPMVLAKQGGAFSELKKSLPFFLPLFGNTQQYWPWILLDDLCSVFLHLLQQPISGIYNASHPNVLTHKEFINVFQKVANPIFKPMPMPDFALQAIMGEASCILTNSQRMQVQKVVDSGFRFSVAGLDEALRSIYP